MSSDDVIYDWMKEVPDGSGLYHGGDIGEVLPPYQTISGTVWLDKSNDGVQNTYRDDVAGVTADEPGIAGVQVSLERYYYVADGGADWKWDTQWADEAPTQFRDQYASARNDMVPGVGAWEKGGANVDGEGFALDADGYHVYDLDGYGYANVLTDADGRFAFDTLKSSDVRRVDAAGNLVAPNEAGEWPAGSREAVEIGRASCRERV